MLTLFITPKHRILILEFILRVFVQIIHCDRWLLCTALALNGRWCPLISYGVISSRLPSLIRLGTVTLQATTTKHARQVWLSPLRQIDIKLSHRASAIKHSRIEHSDTPVKGYRRSGQLCPQPKCDRLFKEFLDSLTSPPPHFPSTSFITLPALPPSSVLFSFLSRPD